MAERDDIYIARAKAALVAAEAKKAGYRGDCADCLHRRYGLNDDTCEHPAVVLVAFNETDAYNKKRIQTCAEQRDTRSIYGPVVCGPNGALFEARGGQRSGFFGRLFGSGQ